VRTRHFLPSAVLFGALATSCAECVPEIEFVGEDGGAQGGGGASGSTSSSGTASWTTSTTSSSTTGSKMSGCGELDGCDVAVNEASDDFEDGADGWCRLVPPMTTDPEAKIACKEGDVVVRASSSTWNIMGYAPFLHRRIAASDDFLVAARLTVSGGAGGDPIGHAHGGGILIRRPNPRPGSSEAVVLLTRAYHNLNDQIGMSAVGYVQDSGGYMAEQFIEVGGGTDALAICKRGNTYRFFHHEGVAWSGQLAKDEYVVNDLLDPEMELEVGLTAHAYDTPEIVELVVDGVIIKPVDTNCAQELERIDPNTIR
jgi:hypothetical protein